MSPPKAEITELTTLNYLVNSTASPMEQVDEGRIPSDVLSKIQVLASVPEYVDIRGDILPLTLRLRTKDLGEEHCKRIQLTEVHVDITQQEKCRYSSHLMSTYLSFLLLSLLQVPAFVGIFCKVPATAAGHATS